MISCHSLSKKYDSYQAIENISINFEEGKWHSIIGKSGAGKTTLLRCLSKIEHQSSGQISYKTNTPPGIVFQSYSLLQYKTILHNVMLPVFLTGENPKKYYDYAHELLEIVGLSQHINSYPGMLSGGQKQRVAIARALILKPKILFCDELTSALDPEITHNILKLLKNTQNTMSLTIIMITHDLKAVKNFSDYIYIMSQGKIIESGKTLDILLNPKQKITKEYISRIYNTDLSNLLNNSEIKKEYSLYHLKFHDIQTYQPLISQIYEYFNHHVNVLSGSIDYIGQTPLGHLIVSMKYEKEKEEKIKKFLKKNNVILEKIRPPAKELLSL